MLKIIPFTAGAVSALVAPTLLWFLIALVLAIGHINLSWSADWYVACCLWSTTAIAMMYRYIYKRRSPTQTVGHQEMRAFMFGVPLGAFLLSLFSSTQNAKAVALGLVTGGMIISVFWIIEWTYWITMGKKQKLTHPISF